jgi:uncharacterized membrane protein
MARVMFFVGSVGLGAALMYFYDPQSGGRRRALANDRYQQALRTIEEARQVTLRDLSSRAHDVAAETRQLVRHDPVRGISGGLGALLALAAMVRGGVRGLVYGAIGSSLLARAATHRDVKRVTMH